MFAYYTSAFGDNALGFGPLLHETAMTELTIIYFVCFIHAAEYCVADLFTPAHLRRITDDDQPRTNKGVLVSFSSKMRADV